MAGRRLGAGSTLVFSPYIPHRHPGFHAEPNRFRPDREHADGIGPGTWSRSSFVPFGSGPHKCIGDTFALTEATLAPASIASRRRLRPASAAPVRPTPRSGLTPRALPMHLIRRRIRGTRAAAPGPDPFTRGRRRTPPPGRTAASSCPVRAAPRRRGGTGPPSTRPAGPARRVPERPPGRGPAPRRGRPRRTPGVCRPVPPPPAWTATRPTRRPRRADRAGCFRAAVVRHVVGPSRTPGPRPAPPDPNRAPPTRSGPPSSRLRAGRRSVGCARSRTPPSCPGRRSTARRPCRFARRSRRSSGARRERAIRCRPRGRSVRAAARSA
ncbi:cytochrome P450 [Embleya scabrispora]|uniref:cytochrome P450 n=1 Tax=Embleya scabrispora TaxID=159449 RepID=UPI003CCBE33A